MVKGRLAKALDWPAQSQDESGQYSCRVGDVWHIVRYGPGYLLDYRVTRYDDAGLAWLQRHDEGRGWHAEDQTVRP